MDFKTIPSDNIYKFLFFTGLFLIVFLPYYFSEVTFELELEIYEYETEVNKMMLEQDHDIKIIDEYTDIQRQHIDKMKERMRLHNSFMEKFDAKNTSVKELNEFNREVSNYDSLITVLDNKSKELESIAKGLILKTLLRAEDLMLVGKKIQRKLKRETSYNLLGLISGIIGSLLLYIGLGNWGRLQDMSERIMYKELGEEPPEFKFFKFRFKWFKNIFKWFKK